MFNWTCSVVHCPVNRPPQGHGSNKHEIRLTQGGNTQENAPLQRDGDNGQENIYDEVYEMPERNTGARAKSASGARAAAENTVPSYYVN